MVTMLGTGCGDHEKQGNWRRVAINQLLGPSLEGHRCVYGRVLGVLKKEQAAWREKDTAGAA